MASQARCEISVSRHAETMAWTRRYRAALGRFIRVGPSARPSSAEKLGRQAAQFGLETLTVVGVHEKALHTMTPAKGTPGHAGPEQLERADAFFKETIVPIEATHRAARKADSRIDRLTSALRQRAAAASASDKQLEQAIARREAAEANAHAFAVRHDELLAQTRGMQQRLRERMRGILSQQEGERKRLGGELRDTVAQALIAIDLSLLTLKTNGPVNTAEAKKNIADAQQILKALRTRGCLSGAR